MVFQQITFSCSLNGVFFMSSQPITRLIIKNFSSESQVHHGLPQTICTEIFRHIGAVDFVGHRMHLYTERERHNETFFYQYKYCMSWQSTIQANSYKKSIEYRIIFFTRCHFLLTNLHQKYFQYYAQIHSQFWNERFDFDIFFGWNKFLKYLSPRKLKHQ